MTGEIDSGGSQVAERWNRVFGALEAEPRRQVVLSLLEAPDDRRLSLPEAANPPFDRRNPEALYLELRHVHLPLLAEAGYVTWEERPLSVRRGPAFAEVAAVFEALQRHVDRLPSQLVEGCARLETTRRRSRP